MKMLKTLIAVTLIMLLSNTMAVYSQSDSLDNLFEKPKLLRRDMSGPRLGMTLILGQSGLAKTLKAKGLDNYLSQFGWHFEHQVVPKGGGPAFVVEVVPLLAGVEYGTLIPSGSFMLGIRLENGFEFGMGPNVMLGSDKLFNTSLILAIGKTIDYGGVSLPLNLTLSTSPSGQRLSFIFGYAIEE